MLFFDARGHLTPYDLIQTDWQTFVRTFGWNEHRRILVDSLVSLLGKLHEVGVSSLDIWIDGSFVTQKAKPNDVDIVLFLPSPVYRLNERTLGEWRNQFRWLDLYFVRKIEQGQRDYFLFEADRAEWLFQFTMTRPDRRTHQKYPKGFLQISWNDEQTLQSEQ